MVRKQLIRMLRGGDKYSCNKQSQIQGDNGLKDKDYLCHQVLEYEKGQTIVSHQGIILNI